MKRSEVMKHSKKLLSAVLAASMIAATAVPETLLAADFTSDMEATVESGTEAVPEAETETVPEAEAAPETGETEPTANLDGGFTSDADAVNGSAISTGDTAAESDSNEEMTSEAEGIAAYNFTDGNSVAAEVPESVKALQNRIDTLPTVEEFKAMADGTTVEGSTLNQQQMDVYNETQSIADSMDDLTEEEQGMLVISKLESLCEWFNNQTDETADYTIGENDGFTVEEDKSLTATFSVTGSNLDMEGWLLCFLDKKPDVNKQTNKLTNSGSAHPYTYSDCKYYFFVNSSDQKGQIKATWSKDSKDVKGSGKTLANVIEEDGCADLYIVIGPRYTADWKNPGTEFGTGKDNIYENCDYYVGRAGDVISSAWHRHTWQYTKDENSNTIKATCIQELGAEYCKYYGKDVLTLGFAPEVPYEYNRKPVSHVIDNITSVTKENVVIQYNGREDTEYSSAEAPKNVGKYTVTVTLGKQTISGDFEITKKKIKKPERKQEPITYSGWNQYCVDQDYDGWYNVSSAENDDDCINVGSHTAKVSLADPDNTEWEDGTTDDVTYPFEIEQATPQIYVRFVDYDSWSYDSTGFWNYGQTSGLPKLREESYPQDRDAEFIYSYKEKNADDKTYKEIEKDDIYKLQAGEYTLKVAVTKTLNCKAGFETCDFTIRKVKMETKPSITITDWEKWKYGDEPKTPALTDESELEGGTVTYTYYTDESCTQQTTELDGASETGAQPTFAGKYWVKATISGMTNYEDTETDPVAFTIEKATGMAAPNVTVVNETYKGQKGQLTGVSSEMEYRKASEESYTGIDGDSVTGLEPGTYYVRYRNNRNHDASDEKEVTIAEGKNLELHLPESETQAGYTITLVNSNVETWPGSATFRVDLKEGYSRTDDFAVKVNGTSVTPNEDGTYTIKLLEDANITVTGIADITEPTGSIQIGESSSKGFVENVTFDQYFKEKLKVELTAQDAGSGIESISYYLADKAMSKDEVKDLPDNKWTAYTNAFYLDSDGNYVVYAKLTDKDGNVKYLSSNGMVIDSTPAKVEGAESNKTYTKSTTVTVTDANLDKVMVNEKEITLAQDGSFVLTPSSEAYDIKVTDKAGNVTRIEKVKVDWQRVEVPEAGSKVYTGTPLKSDLVGNDVYEVVENMAGTDVGFYNVVLKLKDIVNYKWNDENAGKEEKTIKFEITKAATEVTAPTEIVLTYNGKDQKLVEEGTTTFGVLEYSLDEKNWSENVPVEKNVGNYNVYYRVVGNDNFESVKAEPVRVTIARKNATVTANSSSKVYGGEEPVFTYNVDGVVPGETLAEIDVRREKGENAGNYEITASQKEGANPNYSITFIPGTFTITKAAAAAPTKKPEVKADVTYTGASQTLVTAGEVTDGTLMYQVNDGEWTKEIPTAKDAGTYKVSYKIVNAKNYNDSEAVTLTVTVAPKAVTVTADNASKVYGSADGSLTYKAEGLAEGEELSDITVSRKAGEEAGTYEITASQKEGSNPNYTITFIP